MEKLDRLDWYNFRNGMTNKINRSEFDLICKLHAKYYKHSFYKPCTCNPKTIKQWIAQLNDVYDKQN